MVCLAYQDQLRLLKSYEAMGARSDLREGARAVQRSSVAYEDQRAMRFFHDLMQDL